jgi:UDP-N-acetylglucosamine 2-epimerase (non-hydrolysing)
MGGRESVLGPVLCVVGARPNYMKMAPLLRAFACEPSMPRAVLVHTGQHYDYALNDRLFVDLQLPRPDLNLEVGSGTHAVQTAEVMKRFEPVVDDLRPSAVLVVGDVNSTLACSLVAAKKGVAVIHVEAGLRSFDRAMPEEINRVLTDQIADLLYTTERRAHVNLEREGVASERVVFVGNLMIDSLHAAIPQAVAPEQALANEGVASDVLRDPQGVGVVTLHRPSNVDDPATLQAVLGILAEVAQRVPLIWPLHPRTRAVIERAGLAPQLSNPRLVSLPPQGYLEMVGLLNRATVVLTDSGGVREESTALGVPCLTMRANTERPITIEQGTNTIVGRDRALILRCIDEIVAGGGKRGRIPELWDGKTGGRIAAHLGPWLANHAMGQAVAAS